MNNYPKTDREQCIRMLEQGANRNFVNAVARESGVDFDEETHDEFNRDNNNIE